MARKPTPSGSVTPRTFLRKDINRQGAKPLLLKNKLKTSYQFKNSVYRIWTPDGYYCVVPQKYMDEIKNLPDHQVDFFAATLIVKPLPSSAWPGLVLNLSSPCRADTLASRLRKLAWTLSDESFYRDLVSSYACFRTLVAERTTTAKLMSAIVLEFHYAFGKELPPCEG